MTDRTKIAEKLKSSPVMWKKEYAGMVGQPGWVVLVDEDPDPFPCLRVGEEDGHPAECVERWATAFGLPAETREQAEHARDQGDYIGSEEHISECELTEDKPPEWM